MRHRSIVLAAALILAGSAFPNAAPAEDSVHRAASASSGQPARIGVFATLKPDCTAGPAPEVRVLTPPRHGTLIVRSGRMKTSQVKRCPDLVAPVKVVIYQSGSRFQGTDQVAYEVTNVSGKIQRHHVTITVDPRPRPARENDLTEL